MKKSLEYYINLIKTSYPEIVDNDKRKSEYKTAINLAEFYVKYHLNPETFIDNLTDMFLKTSTFKYKHSLREKSFLHAIINKKQKEQNKDKFICQSVVNDIYSQSIYEKELEEMEIAELKSHFDEIFKILTPIEQSVLIDYYNLNYEGRKTQEQIAKKYNISDWRVSQIIHKALLKLRHPKCSRKIHDFLW